MMKEDVTDFPKWAKAYKERCQEHHLKQLQQLCTSSVDYQCTKDTGHTTYSILNSSNSRKICWNSLKNSKHIVSCRRGENKNESD